MFVASALGDEGQGLVADVNEDGIVNILDLVSVAGALGDVAAAPSLHPQALAMFTAADVGQWLVQAQTLDPDGCNVAAGSAFLEPTSGGADTERDGNIAELPEPVQPGDVDPVSVGRGLACHDDDL